jgi:uncharacterized protein YgiB involved in biofilm formation
MVEKKKKKMMSKDGNRVGASAIGAPLTGGIRRVEEIMSDKDNGTGRVGVEDAGSSDPNYSAWTFCLGKDIAFANLVGIAETRTLQAATTDLVAARTRSRGGSLGLCLGGAPSQVEQ